MVASTGPEMEQEQDITTWSHCDMWSLLALLSSSMLHNSHLSRSPSMCLCVKLCRMFESAPTSSGFLEVRREPGLSLQMILLPSLALEWQQLVARPGPGPARWLT